MIVNDRIVSYIHSLESPNSPICEEIERYARQTHVPIIRKEMESFLKVMLLVKKPKRILELGTAIGYSAILMSEYMPKEATITTIENYEKRIPIARENIKKAQKEDKIQLLEGDASQIMDTLTQTYDFVFMDAAKGQYKKFLPQVMRLLENGGLLISDNVLQEGELTESRYAVTRRNRTIHSHMREYLYEVTHRPDLETTILPLGDGVALSYKREKTK